MSPEELSPAEWAQLCRMKIAQINELEGRIRRLPPTQQNWETLRGLDITRRSLIKSLGQLENPSLWWRINRWVNNWAAADRAKEEERKKRRRDRRRSCPRCNGSGQVQGPGKWFVRCTACSGTGKGNHF